MAKSAASPKPKRVAAEKAPVRKATPTKSAPAKAAGKTSPARTSKPTKAAPPPKKTSAKAGGASPANTKSTKKTAPRPVAKQPTKSAPVTKTATPHARTTQQPAAQRPTPTKQSPTSATLRQQPSRDEAAALRAFERAHKEFVRGRFSEARMLFRALIEQHAGVPEVTARARTYLTIAEARLRSEAALPRDAEALYDRGVIELNRGDYVAAQEMFERAVRQDEQSGDIHYALAATRARLGSVESALQSLERALNLKPALRVRAQHDADLASLRNEPDYERLIYPSSRP